MGAEAAFNGLLQGGNGFRRLAFFEAGAHIGGGHSQGQRPAFNLRVNGLSGVAVADSNGLLRVCRQIVAENEYDHYQPGEASQINGVFFHNDAKLLEASGDSI